MLLILSGVANPDVVSGNQNQVRITVELQAVRGDEQARLSYSTNSAVTLAAPPKTKKIKEASGPTPVSQTAVLTNPTKGSFLVTIDVAVKGAIPASWPVSLFWK